MSFIEKYIGDLFIPRRLYIAMIIITVLFIISFFIPALNEVPPVTLYFLITFLCIDYFFLFLTKNTVSAHRTTADRFSNGDQNTIRISVKNGFSFQITAEIIDEIPEQFQLRNWKKVVQLKAKERRIISYQLKPTQRGEYHFGNLLVFVRTPLGLTSRKFSINESQMIPVYPSFMQLRKYELLSRATIQNESGTKRMRKIGHSMEFEQIKEYVHGDDLRTLNWKASARNGGLMVNTYTDEKSQQVYCIIDKGRLMKMPFNGLTLLDYAINSCLVLSNVCLRKQDRVGVITFSNKLGSVLAADRKPVQKDHILQLLYNQETDFLESDFEMLYLQVRNRIRNRSLLVLFTNFESVSGLKRQLDYLRSMASHHILVIIFFENTELHQLINAPVKNIEGVYVKTIAEKFAFEKRLIVKELLKHGILSILTTPQKLTIDTINKYLDLKSRQAI
jgi:uncharacterized protein (DUF58 family)